MKNIEATNKHLTFNGHPNDAIALVDDIREVYTEVGSEPPKTLSDWLFSIECELQRAGYMDEYFNTL